MLSRLCSALLDRLEHHAERFLSCTTDWLWKD